MTKSKSKSMPRAVANIVRGAARALGIGSTAKGEAQNFTRAARKALARKAKQNVGYNGPSMTTHVPRNPSTYVPQLRSRASKTRITEFDFSTANITVCSNAGQVMCLGGISSSLYNLSLDPTVIYGSTNVFGAVSNVIQMFAKFRYKRLKVQYLPFVSTSTVGAVAFAPIADGAILPGTNYTGAQVLSSDKSVTTPIWAPVDIDVSDFVTKEWMWVLDGSTASTAAERQTTPGTVVMAAVAAGTASTVHGILRITGTIEVIDIRLSLSLPLSQQNSLSVPEEAKEEIPQQDKNDIEAQCSEFRRKLLIEESFPSKLSYAPDYSGAPSGLATRLTSSSTTPVGWTSVQPPK